jgi:hypothetical protein
LAFWANAAAHFAASVQGVPLEAGTEIILESTSSGAAGEFYERWLDAEAGRGDYIPIFLPWWLSKEYSREPEAGFQLLTEAEVDGEMSEQEYADTWKLSLRQMCWRRYKIFELRSLQLFQREYPASPSEAWTAPPGMEPFISRLLTPAPASARALRALARLSWAWTRPATAAIASQWPRAAGTRCCGFNIATKLTT